MLQASIIIRTRNEERHVGEVLARVRDQRRIAFEVIVVDSGSTDATLSIVRKVPDIRLIEIPASSFTYGRALNI
ncbi:MAG: glycosyltransferase, partial [Deltaproteobacteria bacterium]|nr:glycosyltransferase [Deltaproteobacteria bacterium]